MGMYRMSPRIGALNDFHNVAYIDRVC